MKPLGTKGDEVGLARFMSAIYKARDEDKFFDIRAWQLAVICVRLGYETKKALRVVGQSSRAFVGCSFIDR